MNLYEIVKKAVNNEDPIGILRLGQPDDDEYSIEIECIVNRLKECKERTEDNIFDIVYSEFCNWFTFEVKGKKNMKLIGKQERYRNIAKEICSYL